MALPEQGVHTPLAEQVLITSLMRALSLFRWATLTVAWVGLALSRQHLIRPVMAVVLLAVASVVTAFLHVTGRSRPERLSAPRVLVAEIAVAVVVLIGDGFVYLPERTQSLPWAWPAACIAAVGIARGGRIALAVAALVGGASLFAEVFLLDRFDVPGDLPTAISKVGLWMLVGGLAGPLTDRLRRAEQLISVARAREEVARQLHDGVLQTLAVVQRRSGDRELASLAREQETELRLFLSDDRLTAVGRGRDGDRESVGDSESGGMGNRSGGPLEPVLREVAAQAERRYGHDSTFAVTVLVAPDCPELSSELLDAAGGAVGEALTNAAKHGGAERVTIFAEPTDGVDDAASGGAGSASVFVSVKDNGSGFEVDRVTEGIGLSRSIKGRVNDVGGTVEVRGGLGRGTEILLWL